MTKYWKEKIKREWLTDGIVKETIEFAEKFGSYLAKSKDLVFIDEDLKKPKTNKKGYKLERNILTTNQLRRFFGEVKKQQTIGFETSSFLLLKPKLAYAVGKSKDEDGKIHDFYYVLSDAIDKVSNDKEFKNFIKVFESIVAYHRAAEESKLESNIIEE
jgi:CRISPR type III-A-associated protein Csm2